MITVHVIAFVILSDYILRIDRWLNMISYQAIVLAAGQGKRMQAGQNKQFLTLQGKPLIIHTLYIFNEDPACTSIKLVINPQEEDSIQELVASYQLKGKVEIVYGGKERQDSVYEGLCACQSGEEIVLIHDGARPFVKRENLHKLAEQAYKSGAALLAVQVTDTIKSDATGSLTTLDRQHLWAAQTPQAFQLSTIKEAHEKAKADSFYGTDDTSLVERLNGNVEVVEGSYDNIKLTTPEDMEKAHAILEKRVKDEHKKERDHMFRIGQGFDVHQLAEDRPCIIGGIEIPYEKGLLGHSDADVLLHTVADACLGAIGEGDIGKHFPDTDPTFKDADSQELLRHVWKLVQERGYSLGNIDCTVIAQAPKMAPYIEQIRNNIARILEVEPSQINVKATTTEKLGFPGRKEGVAAQAVVLLQRS